MGRILWVLLGCLFLIPSSYAASFDCAKAVTKVEKAICSNDKLSQLDSDLSVAYKRALESSRNKQRVIHEERQWIHNVRDVCSNITCLTQAYKERLRQLRTISCSSTSSSSCSGGSAAHELDEMLGKNPAKVFLSILPKIKASTTIPILLPSELPAPIVESSVHYVDGDGEKNKYNIDLYYEADMGDAGFLGYFAGERRSVRHPSGEHVKLVNGITGYFWATSCGGSCAPPRIVWQLNGVLYTIQLNVAANTSEEEKQALTATADSAILGGVR